jgi:hypothetical protein
MLRADTDQEAAQIYQDFPLCAKPVRVEPKPNKPCPDASRLQRAEADHKRVVDEQKRLEERIDIQNLKQKAKVSKWVVCLISFSRVESQLDSCCGGV